mmetsp:Transcript_20293/g.48330  ORF Transcript_20293/g.48330 Transcript_20293/m.48330 type:complete len:313 (-) Transcript_20293:18-956(-)
MARLGLMHRHASICSFQAGGLRTCPRLRSVKPHAASATNGLTGTAGRISTVSRKTKETDVTVTINLDGTGVCRSESGIPFLDHMMDQIASHGLFDLTVDAKGDYWIDDHHTNEDIALALGTALAEASPRQMSPASLSPFSLPRLLLSFLCPTSCCPLPLSPNPPHACAFPPSFFGGEGERRSRADQLPFPPLSKALGDRKGIHRFGDFTAPLDESLIHVVLDLSGRPHLSCGLEIPTERVGTYDTQLVEHFFESLANTSGMTLHIRQLAGRNSHHIIEATFKAFARALRRACEADPRRAGQIASSKGVLTQK